MRDDPVILATLLNWQYYFVTIVPREWQPIRHYDLYFRN